MRDILHVRIKPTENAQEYSVSITDIADAVDIIRFQPSDALQKGLTQLYERSPGLRLLDLDRHDDVSRTVGVELFTTFFRGAVLDAYDAHRKSLAGKKPGTGRKLRLGLHLPRSLYRYPWELLLDPRQEARSFIALVGSVVRYDDGATDAGDRGFDPASDAMVLLTVASTPAGKVAVAPRSFRSSKRIKFERTKSGTWKEFLQKCNSTKSGRGFMFFGHGEISQIRGKMRGSLLFEKAKISRFFTDTTAERYQGREVGVAVGSMNEALIACLFACESAWAQQDIEFEETVTGALLESTSLAFVVGAQTPIDAIAAGKFCDGFLESLTEKDPVPLDLAMSAGRRAVYTDAADGQELHRMDWWIPALYARTTQFRVLVNGRDALPELQQHGDIQHDDPAGLGAMISRAFRSPGG